MTSQASTTTCAYDPGKPLELPRANRVFAVLRMALASTCRTRSRVTFEYLADFFERVRVAVADPVAPV